MEVFDLLPYNGYLYLYLFSVSYFKRKEFKTTVKLLNIIAKEASMGFRLILVNRPIARGIIKML